MDTQSIVRAALFAALIAALGLVPRIDVPVAAGVPITAQTLGVMLAGVMLGARTATGAVALFLFVVALGAPFLSGGRGGIGVFFGPTAGYLAGWVFGAAMTGYAMRRLPMESAFWRGFIAALIGGVIVVHAFGVAYLAFAARLSLANAFIADAVFLPGDVLKAVVAGLVARSYFTARAKS